MIISDNFLQKRFIRKNKLSRIIMPLRNKFSGKARRIFYHTFTYWQFTKPLVFTKENSEFVTAFTYHHFIFQDIKDGNEKGRGVGTR